MFIVSMSDRDEFVAKIENELRKPENERSQDLITFWKDELKNIPIVQGVFSSFHV